MAPPTVFVFATECGITTYYFDTKILYPFLEKMVTIMEANTLEYGSSASTDLVALGQVYNLCAMLMNDEVVLDDTFDEFASWTDNRLLHYKSLIGDFPFPQELLEELVQNPDYFCEMESACNVIRKYRKVDGLRLLAAAI